MITDEFILEKIRENFPHLNVEIRRSERNTSSFYVDEKFSFFRYNGDEEATKEERANFLLSVLETIREHI